MDTTNFYLLTAIIKDKHISKHREEAIVKASDPESAWDVFDRFADYNEMAIIERLKTIPFPTDKDSRVIYSSPFSTLEYEIRFKQEEGY